MIYLVKPVAQQSRNQIPLNKGGKGVVEKLAKTRPHETRPRKNGEWGKDVFTEQYYITQRGNYRQNIFQDDANQLRYLSWIDGRIVSISCQEAGRRKKTQVG